MKRSTRNNRYKWTKDPLRNLIWWINRIERISIIQLCDHDCFRSMNIFKSFYEIFQCCKKSTTIWGCGEIMYHFTECAKCSIGALFICFYVWFFLCLNYSRIIIFDTKKKQIPSASQLKHSINFNVNNGQIVQQNQNLYMFSFTLWFAAVLANWYIPQKQFITWLYVICIVFRQWNMGQTEYII